MLTMDVFNNDAFKATTLSAAVDKMDYVPNFLGSLGTRLFVPDPVRTEDVWIENRSTGAIILPFSTRGSAPAQEGGDQREARAYKTQRIADASRVTASELQGIRAFGSETELKSLQMEVARRQFKIKRSFDLTFEYHRFNCITAAKVINPKNNKVVYNWATEFGQAIPNAVNFALSTYDENGGINKTCRTIRRSILKGLKGVGVPSLIMGLCGDTFFDNLTGNKETRETYLQWAAAEQLRNDSGEWSTFKYGNILFVNYRGTDDGTTLGVDASTCHFFPLGAGIFRWAQSPGERFEYVNTPGQSAYSSIVLDKDRNSFADVEVYSYPLPVCTMPGALAKGTAV